MTSASALALLVSAVLAFQATPPQEAGRWAFVVRDDPFREDSLLDLRFLNDRVAGEKGFIKVNADGDFVYPDGTPVRFWAVNSAVGQDSNWSRPQWPEIRSEPSLARHARFLAKRGVNLVRLHASINPTADNSGTNSFSDDRSGEHREIDWIRRAVAAYKNEGIYVSISPYWAASAKAGRNWGLLAGMEGKDCQGSAVFRGEAPGCLQRLGAKTVDRAESVYRNPLALDPAVAIFHVQNEDSLLFWTVNNITDAQQNHPYRPNSWDGSTSGRFRSTDHRRRLRCLEQRCPGRGQPHRWACWSYAIIWFMTKDGAGKGPNVKRIADQLQFYTETMADFQRNVDRVYPPRSGRRVPGERRQLEDGRRHATGGLRKTQLRAHRRGRRESVLRRRA